MLINIHEGRKEGDFTFYLYTKKTKHKCEGMQIPWNAQAFLMKESKVVFIGTFYAAMGFAWKYTKQKNL